jgi:hypothetical protein
MPLCTIAFIGCFGVLFDLASLGFLLAFLVGIVKETATARGRFRALGLLCLLCGIGAVLTSACAPVSLFGYEVKTRATNQYHLSVPDSPTGKMKIEVWWQDHSRIGLATWWIGGAVSFAGGLMLLGGRAKGWLLTAFAAAGLTGPILLTICSACVKDGWSSGN